MAAMKVLALVLLAGTACSASPARIVGGTATTIENYPALVQVEFLSQFTATWSQSCAGSILTTLHVLSAASCFDGWTYTGPDSRQIRAGSTERGSGGDVIGITFAFNHPTFGQNGYDGDISVVRLSAVLTMSSTIATGAIVSQGWAVPDNSAVTQAGWGLTQQGGSYSDVLLEVTNTVVNRNTCKEVYANAAWPRDVTDNMFCTGTPEGGIDACNGDEGAPLLLSGVIVGLASWGQGCAQPGYPGVNTNVASYTNWIVSTAT